MRFEEKHFMEGHPAGMTAREAATIANHWIKSEHDELVVAVGDLIDFYDGTQITNNPLWRRVKKAMDELK